MPFDLASVERGHGECVAEWQGDEIVLRYRASLDNRAMIAVKRALVGVEMIGAPVRVPDFEAAIDELVRLLLPSGPDVPEHERGWDITRDGVPVAITPEELIALPLGLPVALLMAVFADVSDPNRVRPCSAGSSPADGSEGRLTTTASSKTRNGRISPPGRSPASTTPPAGSAGGSG